MGLVPMSAKPFHAGHYGLIERAANENDNVIVYVSLSDRKRKGELPIKGETMGTIWRQYLEPIMPDNVEVVYGGSPVRNVYEQLGEESKRFDEDDHDVATYTVYSDTEDLSKNFPERNMEKYAGSLWEAGLLDRKAVSRTSTVNVSGTKMRELLSSDAVEEFVEYLPDPLSDEARHAIWNMLKNQ